MTKKVVYHVSPERNKESILSNGLDPYSPENPWPNPGTGRKIHFALGIEDAKKWASQINNLHETGTHMSLYEVNVKGLKGKTKTTDIGIKEHTVEDAVEPSRINHVEDFRPE